MKLTRRTFVKAAGATAAMGAIITKLPVGDNIFRAAAKTNGNIREEKLVPSVCLQCPAGCGILVRVVDGRAVKIEGNPEHPINKGRLCPKGQGGLQILYDPDRIHGPMKRVGARGEGKWQAISWDEAIKTVATELTNIRDAGEPHSLVFLSGRNRGQMGGIIGRFLAAYGSPNDVGHSSICADGSPQAIQLTQGFKAYSAYDWDNTNYLLCFGGSFLEAWRPTTRLLRAFGNMRRGRPIRGKIVQIDTRFSISAAKADEWVPIQPGTDGALALGMAHVIIKEKLYNQDFVTQRTLGFEDFSKLVLEEYSPEAVSTITGIPAETIVRIAREFATTQPGIAAGERGASMQTNGVYNRAAIHSLNALVGSIDVPGGVLVQPGEPYKGMPAVKQDDIAKAGLNKPRIDYAGTKKYPLAGKVYQGIPEFATGQGPYKAKALMMYYTNPLFSTPDVNRMYEAFKQIPFIVNFTPYMSESAQYSDIILPDRTYLERWQDDPIYPSDGYAVVGLRQPVAEPLYNTMDSAEVFFKLAKAMGGTIAESFPWDSHLDLIKSRIQGLYEAKRGSIVANSFDEFWEEFKKKGVWSDVPYTFGNWKRVLPTPSGKFEFVFGYLEKKFKDLKITDEDLTALKITARGKKVYMPHYEPPRYAGDEKQFPLLLNTYKLMPHAEGRGANVPFWQEIMGVHTGVKWDSWVEINPDTGHKIGIEDGDWVWVESIVGKIKTRAKLYAGAMPNVVNMPFEQGHKDYGRWAKERGANPNWILVNETDHLGGLAAFFSTRVKIYKA
ncbi:MAG: anaerobic arsenite oxidase ArxA [Dehalococcoidia bacterium]|nr:anaerobic arsenite oxidase ArxA [Dehalococcoidia bacterium]